MPDYILFFNGTKLKYAKNWKPDSFCELSIGCILPLFFSSCCSFDINSCHLLPSLISIISFSQWICSLQNRTITVTQDHNEGSSQCLGHYLGRERLVFAFSWKARRLILRHYLNLNAKIFKKNDLITYRFLHWYRIQFTHTHIYSEIQLYLRGLDSPLIIIGSLIIFYFLYEMFVNFFPPISPEPLI